MKHYRQLAVFANRRLERLYYVIETGKVSLDDVGPRIRELRQRYEKLQVRREELNVLVAKETLEVPTLEEVRECTTDLRNVLECGSLAERKAFIRGFVKDIIVTGRNAVLNYSPPGLPEKAELNLGGVPRIVQYGGR